MDNRLVLAVLLVVNSWGFMGTHAQNTTTASVNSTATTTTASVNNATTTAASSVNNATTTAASSVNNATTTAASSVNNATTTAASSVNNATTTAASSVNNATTTAASSVNNATTTAASSVNNPTTMTIASTSSNSTNSSTTLTTNTTVVLLATSISRAECGTQQLCAAEPSECDPSTTSSCFLLGAKQQMGQNFEFVLSGESEGYIAASLLTGSTQGVNGTTYVCANNKSVVQFFGALLAGDQLTKTQLPVNSVRGRISGTQIQCAFQATVPDTATRTTASFALLVSKGTFDAASGTLGTPNTLIRTPVVMLAEPNTTVTNVQSITTTAMPTVGGNTAHAVTHQQSLFQVLLVTVSVLVFTMLQRD
ncbi:uncharacterized protein PAE49_021155 [Odontesthes bonariensis]|uniref:uncharacterized protein LOC142369175 n=1 Tax=Odontesthes bonariensis TaxID=219752 RepID=UPI003F583411